MNVVGGVYFYAAEDAGPESFFGGIGKLGVKGKQLFGGGDVDLWRKICVGCFRVGKLLAQGDKITLIYCVVYHVIKIQIFEFFHFALDFACVDKDTTGGAGTEVGVVFFHLSGEVGQ